MHAIPESPNETLLDMRRVALKQLRALDPDIGVEAADVILVNRLGRTASQSSTRQRPLLVRLKSSKLCRQLAQASYKRFVANRDAMQGKPYVTLHTVTHRTPGDVNSTRKLNVDHRLRAGGADSFPVGKKSAHIGGLRSA